jgi:hypothetical protein
MPKPRLNDPDPFGYHDLLNLMQITSAQDTVDDYEPIYVNKIAVNCCSELFTMPNDEVSERIVADDHNEPIHVNKTAVISCSAVFSMAMRLKW